ncbi:beta-propeller domain-containing protein [Maricaulis sp.]|uniref:beta-propeller domain-containing protein n=1 Tax=Maricaulis sp. TaxID=1486257 RepID=UPI0025BCAF79|nr:beta-propeller domain-containing protein [Maricaulis sp.]
MFVSRLTGAIRIMVAACAVSLPVTLVGPAVAQTLPSFEDDDELRAFLAELDENGEVVDWLPGSFYPPPPPPPPPPQPGAASAPTLQAGTADLLVTGSRIDNPGITNVQVAGVDEGGIVKVAGDYLIVLRRGRLFTISTADDDLVAIDQIDAFPPGGEGSAGWYDEMIVSGDLIVIIGFSYEYEATEINRFRLAGDGRLTHLDTHHLRSDDYYSSRNYASRLIGDQLITYAPLTFDNYWGDDPLDSLPALSRWVPGQEEVAFRRIAQARDVYVPAPLKARGGAAVSGMHVVTRCDLAADDFDCRVTVVLGQMGRSFFVSRNATYVWVVPDWYERDDGQSYLYRIPLDGSAPGVARVEGAPLDQFSFHANEAASRLDILVLPDGNGEAMWRAESAAGRPALLRLPTTRFGDGSEPPRPSDYQVLPVAEHALIEHNRYVGDTLLVGLTERGGDERLDLALAVALEGGAVTRLPLDGRVSRIEAVGRDGLVVTQGEGTGFVTVSLTGDEPVISDRFLLAGSAESESRSHAFFFRPEGADGDGLAALPLLSGDDREADMVFLQREAGSFAPIGRLQARARPGLDDGCRASCTDWYGNARPIFLRGRILALLGYEIVEGMLGDKRVEEIGRLNFTPGPRKDEDGLSE